VCCPLRKTSWYCLLCRCRARLLIWPQFRLVALTPSHVRVVARCFSSHDPLRGRVDAGMVCCRPLRRALKVALQLAEALDYCHSGCFHGLRVLHRDLKPNNIGFLADGRLALFDFGLAKLWRVGPDDGGGAEVRPLTGNTGSLRYMAPEVALSKAYSHRAEVRPPSYLHRSERCLPRRAGSIPRQERPAFCSCLLLSQVFAFATLVWQMVSHDRPYADCDVQSFYRRVCHAGERPKIPSGTPKDLTLLLEQCWHVDSSRRPEFAQIIPRLKAVLVEAGGE